MHREARAHSCVINRSNRRKIINPLIIYSSALCVCKHCKKHITQLVIYGSLIQDLPIVLSSHIERRITKY